MRQTLLLLTLLLSGAASAAETGELRSFGDWMVGCDNARACTAIGLAPEDAPAFAYLRVTREGEASAAPEVSIAILDELQTGGVIRLALPDGSPLPVAELAPNEDDPSFAVADLGEADHAGFIDALLPAGTLTVSLGDEEVGVSLDGMSAALRFMDAAQERAGTPGALVARGERPAGTVPAVPERPSVTALALREIDMPAERPSGLPARADACPEGFGDTVWEAADGTQIWAVCASAGAYNLSTEISIVRDGAASPADLGPQGASDNPDDPSRSTLVNAALAEDGRTIHAFARARGLGDCGSITSWAFDGEALALVEEAVMGECRGVRPDDWPVLYRGSIASE